MAHIPPEIQGAPGEAYNPPDFDQHYVTARQMRAVASYDYYPGQGRLDVYAPPWESTRFGSLPGDELIIELSQEPLLQRQASTELLTLPRQYMTMPGTDELPLWEHSWGMTVLTRQLIENAEATGKHFTDREKLLFQVTAVLHDVGKDAFAHLIDWYKQGYDGPQDSHDEEQAATLHLSGIDALLHQHGIEVAEIVSSSEPFMGSSGPDLNTDRVDYGVREILRWVDPGSDRDWQNAFLLDRQGQVVMRDKKIAKRFGVAYGILATEHWGHPVHRLQIQLFGELIKGALLSEDDESMHVFDRMRTADSLLIANTRQIGTLNNDLHALMLNLARDQRRVFSWGKEDDIADFLRPFEYDFIDQPERFLHPLEKRSWKSEYSGVKPQYVDLLRPTEARDFGERADTLDIYLPGMKTRTVDPSYYDQAGTIRRLSETDAHYASLMNQCKAIQAEDYVARIHLAPDAAASLKDKMSQIQIEWRKAVSVTRTEQSRQRGAEHIRTIGSTVGPFALSRHVRTYRQ
jgi:hypothetical protein